MGENVQAGVVQIGLAAAILYAWYVGAFARIVEVVAAGVGGQPGAPLPAIPSTGAAGMTHRAGAGVALVR